MAASDLLLSQVQRGLVGYKNLCTTLNPHIRYDIIIAHETFCSGLASLYYANTNNPNALKILDIVEYPVFSQRSTAKIRKLGIANKYSDSLTYDFAVNIANKFDYCISTSNGQANAYKKNGYKSKIDVIMNCRSSSNFEDSKKNILSNMYGFLKSDIIIIYPNRAYEHCGLETALQALALLDKRFQLVVLGEIVEELIEKIDEIATKLKIKDRFHITGMLDPSMVLPILSEGDAALVLLDPIVDNHKYCLPNRLFDAAAARVPIIGFEGTETGSFINQNNIGTICPHNKPQLLAKSLIETIEKQAYYKERLFNFNNNTNWQTQSSNLINNINNFKPERILLIALKDARRNDRIKRFLEILTNTGCKSVDCISYYKPLDSMCIDGVTYHAIK